MNARLEKANAVADAVLYEGYVLYPYRASAAKNQSRWQFGVLMPPSYVDGGTGEHGFTRTECLLEADSDAVLHVRVRFLHLQRRTVEARTATGGFAPVESLRVGDDEFLPWDEARDRSVELVLPLDELLGGEREQPVEIPGGTEYELVGDGEGRIVRECLPLRGVLRVSADRLPGPYGVLRLHAVVANTSAWRCEPAGRTEALRVALVAAHTAMAVTGGRFVSLLEPPEWAAEFARGCVNEHTWPVLVGARGDTDTVLSSPIILYDYPEVAEESPGQFYDSTEIDELLALRTLTLTDEEKREARATDGRAREIIDRVDGLPPELMDRLHGAVREMRPVAREPEPACEITTSGGRPWWDPGADDSVSPETDTVRIGEHLVAKGSKVVLRPGLRRSDAQDMFLVGRTATVEAVFLDVEDERYLAVSLDDDPAAELQSAHGRYRYFTAEEVVPIGDGSGVRG